MEMDIDIHLGLRTRMEIISKLRYDIEILRENASIPFVVEDNLSIIILEQILDNFESENE